MTSSEPLANVECILRRVPGAGCQSTQKGYGRQRPRGREMAVRTSTRYKFRSRCQKDMCCAQPLNCWAKLRDDFLGCNLHLTGQPEIVRNQCSKLCVYCLVFLQITLSLLEVTFPGGTIFCRICQSIQPHFASKKKIYIYILYIYI